MYVRLCGRLLCKYICMNGTCGMNALSRMFVRKHMDSLFGCTYIYIYLYIVTIPCWLGRNSPSQQLGETIAFSGDAKDRLHPVWHLCPVINLYFKKLCGPKARAMVVVNDPLGRSRRRRRLKKRLQINGSTCLNASKEKWRRISYFPLFLFVVASSRVSRPHLLVTSTSDLVKNMWTTWKSNKNRASRPPLVPSRCSIEFYLGEIEGNEGLMRKRESICAQLQNGRASDEKLEREAIVSPAY